MKPTHQIAAILMTSVLALAGCQVNETATYSPDGESGNMYTIDSRSSALWADLKIEDVKSGRAGNLLRAQVQLRNEDDDPETFKYKFKWFDKDGFEVSTDARPWTPIVINGYELATIQAVAPNPTVVSFQVIVLN